ncbi:MAG: hypothetical protein E4H14_03155 [Candidatus Thorarchaeota archaeon]|nr:MAG: hypothetical protein E4H14_03155 [Candidatus Thorarchaeota archaeon]
MKQEGFSFFRRSNLIILILVFVLFCVAGFPSILVSASATDNQTATWIAMEQEYTEAVFSDVAFLNETHGWVVGQWAEGSSGNGIVMHTADAGETWETQLKNGTEQRYFSIDIFNENSIWVTARGGLYHSSDCGETWEKHVVADTGSLLSTVEFIDENTGWTATNTTLYKTIDGGLNWEIVTGWAIDDNPLIIKFTSATEVWSIGFRGIYHSIDGAETWTEVYESGGWTLSMLDDGTGWAVSDSSLMYTSNGINWTQLPIPGSAPWRGFTLPYLTDILFIEENGWIAAGETPIMHTPDGGSTWYAQSVPSHINRRMMAIDFLNSTYGWAAGADGAILKTTSGTDLGTRLWNGMTDPLFIAIAGSIVGVAAIITGRLFYRRRKRSKSQTTMIQ